MSRSLRRLFIPLLNSNLKAYVEYGNEIWNRGAIIGRVHGQLLANGYAAFPSAGNDNNAAYLYGILRAVKTADIWKSTCGLQTAVVSFALRAAGMDLPLQPYFFGYDSYGLRWRPPSIGPEVAGSYFDALAVRTLFRRRLFGSQIPFTLDQLFTEIMSGGLVAAATRAE